MSKRESRSSLAVPDDLFFRLAFMSIPSGQGGLAEGVIRHLCKTTAGYATANPPYEFLL